jgi:hypothetical protein
MDRKDGKRLKTSAERERTARLQVIVPTDEVAAVDEFQYGPECRAGLNY